MTRATDATAPISRRSFCRALCGGGLVLLSLDGCGTSESTPDGAAAGDLAEPGGQDLAPPSARDLATNSNDARASVDGGDLATPADLREESDLTPEPPDASAGDCRGFFASSGALPGQIAAGTAVFVRAASAFVCRDANGLFAVSSICTHQGADLEAVRGGAGGFHCPWHGSNFALDGAVTGGPAFTPLEHYRLCLDGRGQVAVLVGVVVVPGERMA